MHALTELEAAIAATGLTPRGLFRLDPDEQVGMLAGKQTLVLIGLVGRTGWDQFAVSAEALDGLADPLDRWSRRCIDVLAERFGGTALYPFGAAPFWPFQRWAQRAEALNPSPLGLLIHPDYGLWHSYRGALALAEAIDVEGVRQVESPCASCVAKPCLHACPVGAFTAENYDVEACAHWLRSPSGSLCMQGGCQARRACPVGTEHAHGPDQTRFGMRAFLAAR